MPLSEHTGSHASTEHEQFLLHSEKSALLLGVIAGVLEGKVNFCMVKPIRTDKHVFWGCKNSAYGAVHGLLCSCVY